ncbi:hypothetical protein HYR54_14700 [Candidatus Acetothermia bacterium]|nr:hypothetical protein [Candidatus Acetothermia bacterium]
MKWDAPTTPEERWEFRVTEPNGSQRKFIVETDCETLRWLFEKLSRFNVVEVRKECPGR